jgi:hypothetical protein
MGAARGKRKAERNSTAPREINLSERKSALELGEEVLAVRRGGRTIRMTADDLMLDQLIARCLSGNKHRDYADLFKLLNAQDEAAMLRSRELSPYQRRRCCQSNCTLTSAGQKGGVVSLALVAG